MGAGHSCLRTEQTIAPQHQLIYPALLVVYSTGSNSVPTFLHPVNDVEHLCISLPLLYVVILVECSAVLLPENMEQVGLQAPPDADDIPNLNNILVGFQVVAGAVVDLGNGFGHDGHHCFDALDVVEFLELRIGVVDVDGPLQRQIGLGLIILFIGGFSRIEYALPVLYPICEFHKILFDDV